MLKADLKVTGTFTKYLVADLVYSVEKYSFWRRKFGGLCFPLGSVLLTSLVTLRK